MKNGLSGSLSMTAVVVSTLHGHLKRCLNEYANIHESVDIHDRCHKLALIFEIVGICSEMDKEMSYVEAYGHD